MIRPLFGVSLALTLLFSLVIALRPAGVFWTIDEGGKFTYLLNTLKTGDPAAPLLYPGRVVDPSAEFFPLYYRIERADGYHTWWGTGLPLFSLPFYRLLGWAGLYLLPVLCGGLSVFLSGKIAECLAPHSAWIPPLAALATGLFTPVLFYSTMFWEHTLALALILSGVWSVLRSENRLAAWELVAGGAACSLSIFFRNEAVFFVAGLGLALLTRGWRKALFFGLGLAGCAAVWGAFNFGVTGSVLQPQIEKLVGITQVGLSDVGLKFFPYFLFNPPGMYALPFDRGLLIAGSIFFVGVLVLPFWKQMRTGWLLACLGLLVVLGWAVFSATQYRSVQGALLACPAAVFAVWYFVRKERAFSLFGRILLLSGLIFGAVYLARAWVAAGGLQWGPRYLLMFFPLLCIAALVSAREYWTQFRAGGRILAAGLPAAAMLFSLVVQLRGVQSVWETYRFTQQTRQALGALTAGPIVTDYCEISMNIPDLFWEGRVFSITRSSLVEWAHTAQSHGIAGFYLAGFDLCSAQNLNEIRAHRAQNPGGMTVKWCVTQAVLNGQACAPLE